jgi:transmembrane sensor
MPAPAPSPEIRAEAAAWLARLHAEDRDAADEAAFRAWLNASPVHAAAFEAVDRIWSDVGGLNDFRITRQETQRQDRPAGATASRRALLAGVGLLAVTGGSALFWRSASAKVYETDVGEQKHVALDDGSQLFLDAQTRISVSFSDTARTVDMQYGRANFRVVPDLKRPFIVEAADHRIVATRCNFDVRCEDGQVQVVLIHGEADVKPTSASNGQGDRLLRAGERLVASNEVQKLDKPDLTHVLAWQTGYEIFDKEDLAQAVEEMNRYSTAKLAVDPSVASLKVSGVYRVGDNSAFARSLAKLLPIAVRQTGDTLILTGDTDQ